MLGASLWQTPYQLRQYKLRLVAPEVTPAMLHGTELEPAARHRWPRATCASARIRSGVAAAAAYVDAKRAAEAVTKALGEAKAKLVGPASHTSESGGGVSVTRYWKSGTVD